MVSRRSAARSGSGSPSGSRSGNRSGTRSACWPTRPGWPCPDGIDVWYPTINADGTVRDGAWVAEATNLLDLSEWPTGSRVILRKERPHPGAQLTFLDVDGHRITAFITDTPAGVVPGQLAGLDLRHRQHARVEDRIRQAKATGMRNFPCNH